MATANSDRPIAALHRIPPGADAVHALVIAVDHLQWCVVRLWSCHWRGCRWFLDHRAPSRPQLPNQKKLSIRQSARGDHFAAMEQPEALAHELREFFRPLQRPWPELARGRRCDRKAAHIVACDQLGDQPG